MIIKKIINLSRQEFWVLVKASIMLPFYTLAIRYFGFLPVYRYCQKIPLKSKKLPLEAKTMARLINIAAYRGIMKASCLTRSLYLYRCLKTTGGQPVLQIGFAIKTAFRGHAWVEQQGDVINDVSYISQQFTVFSQLSEIQL